MIETKAGLRRSMRERLRVVSPLDLASWSERLVARLQDSPLWASPGVIALFGGLRSEPDLLTAFAPWLRDRGWRTVLFGVQGTDLLPFEVSRPTEVRRSDLGVWEPVIAASKAVPLSALSVVLVPGLAFARKDGGRLGRGGGYYDRLLAREDLGARRIGVAFEAQVVSELPLEAHDACVPEVVTETVWRQISLRRDQSPIPGARPAGNP